MTLKNYEDLAVYFQDKVWCPLIALFITVEIRGFGEFPIPQAVMFAILAAIAFYTASGLTAEV